MRKVKEFYGCGSVWGYQQNQIARSCSIGQATVHRYLQSAAAPGLSWPLAERAGRSACGGVTVPGIGRAAEPNQYQSCRISLRCVGSWSGRNITKHSRIGTATARFCELSQRWSGKQDVVLRQEHRAGEMLFVDWASDTIPLYDGRTGVITPASFFVAVLGASIYAFARATLGQDLGNGIVPALGPSSILVGW